MNIMGSVLSEQTQLLRDLRGTKNLQFAHLSTRTAAVTVRVTGSNILVILDTSTHQTCHPKGDQKASAHKALPTQHLALDIVIDQL